MIASDTLPAEKPATGPPAAGRQAAVPDGERIYAIGDIHGRLDLLQALIARIRHDAASRDPARIRIVLLGDLVDRGPQSADLLMRCRALAARSRAFVVLKGNHEAMMVDALKGNLNALALWLRTGGDATLLSLGVPQVLLDDGPSQALAEEGRQRIAPDLLAWLDGLPTRHEAGDYLFVHAGIRPGVSLARQSPEDLMWIRREFLESEVDHPRMIVHGHSISETGVQYRRNRIGIDTGAYRTGVLTALALEGDSRWLLSSDRPAIGFQAPGQPRPRTNIAAIVPAADQFEQDVAAILAPRTDGRAGTTRRGPGRRAALASAALLVAATLVAVIVVRSPDDAGLPRPAPGVAIGTVPAGAPITPPDRIAPLPYPRLRHLRGWPRRRQRHPRTSPPKARRLNPRQRSRGKIMRAPPRGWRTCDGSRRRRSRPVSPPSRPRPRRPPPPDAASPQPRRPSLDRRRRRRRSPTPGSRWRCARLQSSTRPRPSSGRATARRVRARRHGYARCAVSMRSGRCGGNRQAAIGKRILQFANFKLPLRSS